MTNLLRVIRATLHHLERWRSARREARAGWRTLWLVYSGLAAFASGASACGVPARDDASDTAEVRAFGNDLGFRSPQRLAEHFAKHGSEFGGITRQEYLRQAQALRDAPVSGTVLEVRREDGVVSRFDRRTGSFLAFDADGIIRTFFRPNDGEAYFRRQARRRPIP